MNKFIIIEHGDGYSEKDNILRDVSAEKAIELMNLEDGILRTCYKQVDIADVEAKFEEFLASI